MSMTVAIAAAIQSACEPVDPEYAHRRADFDKWLAKWARCLPPDTTTQLAQARERARSEHASHTDTQKEQSRRECAQHPMEIAALLQPPKAVYSTPQATWNEFRAALIAKDRKRALQCLSADSRYADAINAMPDENLARFGASLFEIRQTNHQSEEYSEAYAEIAGPDGKKSGALVLFVNVHGNWFIGSL